MSHPALAQANLFGTDPENRGAPRGAVVPIRGQRAARPPNLESAAQLFDSPDGYRLGPDESIALLVDVETTGLDHRTHKVIEIGMVAFAYDAEGRIGSVVGVLGMHHEPRGEISAEIARLTGITAEMVAGQAIDMTAVRACWRFWPTRLGTRHPSLTCCAPLPTPDCGSRPSGHPST